MTNLLNESAVKDRFNMSLTELWGLEAMVMVTYPYTVYPCRTLNFNNIKVKTVTTLGLVSHTPTPIMARCK